ncbi:hypothetical protein BPJM79_40012 [Bacillus pumilus]
MSISISKTLNPKFKDTINESEVKVSSIQLSTALHPIYFNT